MKFYNTLTRKKQEFKPIHKGEARIYSCGPTVYNYAHIGNWRHNIFADILKRYLKYKGYDVKHVMNLTDVDDKTIRDSQMEGVTLKAFTEKYTRLFFADLDVLNIERAEHYPKATEHTKEMVDLVKALKKKKIAYKSEDGSTYYDVSKFKGYGRLSKIKFGQLKSSARVKQDEYEKDSASDFALWKAYDKADGDVFWETDVGKGRPGWHIECSAMSMKYLGDNFDIHTGGIDLIFPHHENEIAQSEAATGKPFVNYWMHNEHLLVENEKMSKSKGNFYILKDILDKGYSPKAIRYLLISTHYRQKLNFTWAGLDAAEKTIERFRDFMNRLKAVQEKKSNPKIKTLITNTKFKFEEAMDDDLNISGGLAAIFDFMHEVNKSKLSRNDALQCFNLMMEFDKVLGVLEFEEERIPESIIKLAEKRLKARAAKNWELADELREEIKQEGYEIADNKEGYALKKI